MANKDATKRVLTAQAAMIAQGLAFWTPDGIRITDTGFKKAAEIWDAIPDEHKFLLIPYLRRALKLKFPEET